MIDAPASDSMVYYDDGNDDCEDCDNQINEYDEEYDDLSSESINELYRYCLTPSVNDTVKYLLPLLLSSVLFRLLAQNRKFFALGNEQEINHRRKFWHYFELSLQDTRRLGYFMASLP